MRWELQWVPLWVLPSALASVHPSVLASVHPLALA
jgi:hypothetical protein